MSYARCLLIVPNRCTLLKRHFSVLAPDASNRVNTVQCYWKWMGPFFLQIAHKSCLFSRSSDSGFPQLLENLWNSGLFQEHGKIIDFHKKSWIFFKMKESWKKSLNLKIGLALPRWMGKKCLYFIVCIYIIWFVWVFVLFCLYIYIYIWHHLAPVS